MPTTQGTRLYIPRWQTIGTVAIYVDGVVAWQARGSRVWNSFTNPGWRDLGGNYPPAGSPVEVQAVLDEAGLRLRVSDYGPGLDEAALEKLGTPYFRAGTSLGKKGSGLGYHFTQRIVQAHGGGLRAHSGAGRGLVVEISLPPEAGAA